MFQVNKEANPSGTSFHGVEVRTTANKLAQIIGEPCYEQGDKNNFEWILTDENNEVFTIYDYKQGLKDRDDVLDFHIGSRGNFDNSNAKSKENVLKDWLEKELDNL